MAKSPKLKIFFVVFVDAAFQYFFLLLQKIHKIFVIKMNVSKMYLLTTYYVLLFYNIGS